MITDSMSNYLEEIKYAVGDLIAESGSPHLAFTQYVLNEMCEKANLGEATTCYAAIHNDATHNVMGEIFGYAKSINGETVCLFYTIYDTASIDEPQTIPAEKYHQAIARLQGYYNAAISGRCNEMEPSADDYDICKYIYENDEDITNVRLFVISNGTIRQNLKTPKERIKDKTVKYATWDINTIYKNTHSGADHMFVDIDLFDDDDFKFKIPFIEMESPIERYQTYIAMLPGEFVYNLYDNFNTDLLQSNVRFFKGKNKCNKEIIKQSHTDSLHTIMV